MARKLYTNLDFQNASKPVNLPDPSSAQDAATKAYVDGLVQGIKWKASVRAATVAAGTLATSFENGDTIDGVALVTGDRILVKDQAAGGENGIYVVAASGAPTRALDANTAAEITQAAAWVEEGTANADTGWVNTTDAPITLGTTATVWAQFSGLGQVTAGAGLTKTGNTLAVGAGTGITVNADDVALTVPVSIANGGTNATTAADARTSLGATTKFSANVGDGVETAVVITHNLNTRDVMVEVYRNSSPWDTVICDVERTTVDTCTLTFASAPSSNQFRVAIVG